jgi:hypothetical protein
MRHPDLRPISNAAIYLRLHCGDRVISLGSLQDNEGGPLARVFIMAANEANRRPSQGATWPLTYASHQSGGRFQRKAVGDHITHGRGTDAAYRTARIAREPPEKRAR